MYDNLWSNLKEEEENFKSLDTSYIPSNVSSFHPHHFTNGLPPPLCAARLERFNNKAEADLASFKYEIRLEVGFLFGILLLLSLAMGALFAFRSLPRVCRGAKYPEICSLFFPLKKYASFHTVSFPFFFFSLSHRRRRRRRTESHAVTTAIRGEWAPFQARN